MPYAPPSTGSASYPPTNAQGERICRQCGLPGRFKDGKCVEKWGPGPEGPGTVCDRCRKKMKRVERRGTLDGQLASTHSLGSVAHPGSSSTARLASHHSVSGSQHSDRSVHRTATMPVTHLGGGIGPGGTQLLSPAPSFVNPQERHRDKTIIRAHPSTPPLTVDKERDRRIHGPSPPAIATLQPDDDDVTAPLGRMDQQSLDVGRRKKPTSLGGSPPSDVRSSEGQPIISQSAAHVQRRANGEAETDADVDADGEVDDVDADADGDADMDGDVDADADLLEAVHAAEAHSSTLKAEDE